MKATFTSGGPAFPVAINVPEDHFGMTLRAYIATAAMQGMLATNDEHMFPQDYVKTAVDYADALIKQLNIKGEA